MRSRKYATVNSLAILCILGLFTLLSLLVIVLGAGFYQRITARVTATDELRASLNYVANKVRFADSARTTLQEEDGIPVISLQQEGYTDYVYYYKGNVMELSVMDSMVFLPDSGDILISIPSFSMERTSGNLLVFRAESRSGGKAELSLCLDNTLEDWESGMDAPDNAEEIMGDFEETATMEPPIDSQRDGVDGP